MQHSSDIFLITGPDTAITYLSPSITGILGYDRAQLTGRKLTDLIHPDDIPRLLAPCAELLRRRAVPAPGATRSYDTDGTLRHMESVVTKLLHQPDIGGLVFNTRDVTEQQDSSNNSPHARSATT